MEKKEEQQKTEISKVLKELRTNKIQPGDEKTFELTGNDGQKFAFTVSTYASPRPRLSEEPRPPLSEEQKKFMPNLVASILKPMGFKKDRNFYQRRNGRITSNVLLSKSRFSNRYFIDVGVIHDEVVEEPSKDFSIRVPTCWSLSDRIELMLRIAGPIWQALKMENPTSDDDGIRLIRAALNIENSMSNEERTKIVTESIEAADKLLRSRWEDENWLIDKALIQKFDPREPITANTQRFAYRIRGLKMPEYLVKKPDSSD